MAPIILGNTFYKQKLYEKEEGNEKKRTLVTFNDKGEIVGEDFIDEKHMSQNYATVLLEEGIDEGKKRFTVATKNERGETLNVRDLKPRFQSVLAE